ncbi:hypothetical protein [Streptomyces sp. ST2-7A]|uniref:hypothetical protein n=1 Tax=Streptomyces sp. ST2-7A TaxID=2907214 RepID=UPI001F3F11D3|nr:hypothetical protein [Streptomyces sp. ST2-7A]MCE7080016.1 hypothetical protein [Streptomyces sp. ST2-7A]
MPIELPRRALLGSAGAIVLGITLPGCSAGESPVPPPAASGRAENGLPAAVTRQSAGLVERYNATLLAHPSLAGLLGPLRTAAAADLEGPGVPAEPDPAIDRTRRETLPGETEDTGSPEGVGAGMGTGKDSGRTDGRADPRPSPGEDVPEHRVPGDPDAALAALATEERRVSEERLHALGNAPAESARLLASLSAAGAARTYLLTGARG